MLNHLSKLSKNLSIIIVLITSQAASAHEIRDIQSWWNITAIGTLGNKSTSSLKYWLEGQERVGDDMSRLSQEIYRPGLGYALTKTMSIWLGYAWVRTGIPFTNVPFSERRLWEQFIWQDKFKHLTLMSRTRLEQRYLNTNPTTGWRFRELFKMISPLTSNPRWSIVGYDEVFFNLNNLQGQRNTGFEQNRFFMGMGYKFNTFTTIEIGYLNQYIHRRSNNNFMSNDISTTLFLNF